jgi:hexosaminidase
MFPLPSESRTGASVIGLDDGFVIAWSKAKRPAQDLVNAITKTNRAVLETTHRFLSPDRGASLSRDCTVRLGTMIVVLESEDPGSIMSETLKPLRERREAYTLIVPDDGQSPAVIRSTSSLGVFRGLTTFEQLFYAPPVSRAWAGMDSLGSLTRMTSQKNAPGDTNFTVKAFAPSAPYIISDKPAFPWRGFMLDTSRNFFSKQTILKVYRNLLPLVG